ncbi:acyltransferase domain-containing protein [Pendulispora brunnea]|uniref:Acyltransferase domain-containing protein n=1 Tax=Pendulispora brunnea TaxID=2905690 RepID=A0ABZ2KJ98_9BACT
MSPPGGSDETASLLRHSLMAIRELRAKLEAYEQAKHEPMAIVGMGCRYPGGADSPGAFWSLLENGVDAITEVPHARWEPSECAMRYGAFLESPDLFDAAFFGISPREAARMDPQQRLLLEVAWHAIEDAGLTAEKLAGSATGVFVGANSTDYWQLQLSESAGIDTYTVIGASNCIIANRLSYCLDLRGPSMTVDTACSSSLVAVALAAQSLRARECDTAIVAGMNMVLSPQVSTAHSKGLPLAADGRCKTFDARADGYVRGEGVGCVILKRLSDATRAGDRIWAVVKGWAVNQDGLSNGLTAPNGDAQRAVIQRALAGARISPDRIGLIEAHGTGTELGDPIEVEALKEEYGTSGARPCALGSLKTNIGHLEAGAGIAGLIKAALAIHHGAIPRNLHFEQLNEHIGLDGTRFFVPTARTPWDVAIEDRYAAVSSFGAGGTNAHVILGGPSVQSEPRTESAAEEPRLLVLSARTERALIGLAERYADVLDGPEENTVSLRALCASAGLRRTHHPRRASVVASTRAEAAFKLRALAAAGVARAEGKSVVFVFPGQGSQWPGMARGLFAFSKAFRAKLEECDRAIRVETGWSVTERLFEGDGSACLEGVHVIQPILFALQVSLAAAWRSFGVEPDAVVGHSMGEVAAAHVAGILQLEHAAAIICRRSALLRKVAGRGAMALVALSAAEARTLLVPYGHRIEVAASNSPHSTVLSGEPEALEYLLGELRGRNVFCRAVKVDVASHSRYMDPLREDLLRALSDIAPREAEVPLLSTVLGAEAKGPECGPSYWVKNLRDPVLFTEAVQALADDEDRIFIELSPHPILLTAIEQTFSSPERALPLASMSRDENEVGVFLASLGAVHARGVAVDFEALFGQAEHVALPLYPFDRERFWYRQAPRVAQPIAVDAPTASAAKETPAEPVRRSFRQELSALGRAEAAARIEQLTCDCVAGVLGMHADRLDRRDGFFQIGMDSRMAAQVAARLSAELGEKVPVTTIIENPRVAALARHLELRILGPAAPSRRTEPSEPVEPSEEELLALLAGELSPHLETSEISST